MLSTPALLGNGSLTPSDNPQTPGSAIKSLASSSANSSVEAAATVVAMNKVLSKTPAPDDSELIGKAMQVLVRNTCKAFRPHFDPTLRIVSICSSSDTPYNYVIPCLLELYGEHSWETPIQAQITHVIPPHKTVTMINQRFEDQFANIESNNYRSRQEDYIKGSNDDYFTYHDNSTTTAVVTPTINQENSNSGSGGGGGRSSTSSDYDRSTFYRDRIYNNFALISRKERHLQPSVPPESAHYAITIHPIPTHVLPPFESIVKTRFTELVKGGLMLICYPSSRKLYDNHVLPCLDLALHQLLALNMISTSACEAVSVAPASDMIPSFELQKQYLESLGSGAEILYAEQINDFKCSDWGYRWLNEEIEWLRKSLANAGLPSSQVLLKLIERMTNNAEWKSLGSCDASVFVIRKS